LDAEELFTLGVKASRANDSVAALACLKQAIAKDPTHAEAHWLLGAEYASLGMPDRARASLEQAIELGPQLHTARFQLGLLQLTSGFVEEARGIWQPLDELPLADPLRLFKQGLLHMVNDEFEQALAQLQQALATPGLDTALRGDMDMVVQQIQSRAAAKEATAALESAKEPTHDALAQSHFAFSAYQRGLSDKKH
jgi:Flp pilus assembly protein TadD